MVGLFFLPVASVLASFLQAPRALQHLLGIVTIDVGICFVPLRKELRNLRLLVDGSPVVKTIEVST